MLEPWLRGTKFCKCFSYQLNACLGQGGDLFKEIKAIRKSAPAVATSIDGVGDNIPEHFASIYSQLYNSADDTEKLKEVHARVEAEVNPSHLIDVSRITPDLLKQAASKLKPGKSDPIYIASLQTASKTVQSLFINTWLKSSNPVPSTHISPRSFCFQPSSPLLRTSSQVSTLARTTGVWLSVVFY